jgi:hydrogenase maturation factor
VQAIASDVATSGFAPTFALFELNLPPPMQNRTLMQYWKSIHQSCRKLGISIIGGHTGRFEGCDYTVVGGGTMLAIGSSKKYVTTNMAKNGDELILTKSAALEAAAVLASSFPETVSRKLGSEVLEKTQRLIDKTSTVEDATTAASTGVRERGVTAMHDVTEGGIISAILDLAEASRLRATIDEESIPVFDEVRKVCELFHIDPLKSLGQGSLVIACRPHGTDVILQKLKRSKIPARMVGILGDNTKHSLIRKSGRESRLTYPKTDPYWNVYWNAVHRKLR